MRPVLLEMDGFASFRQRTTVNFDDVDYFALIGPTGAGKSTVLDAIAFALYGSVARWDDARAVEPALAPSVNRGTVRLVFEVRGERYQVMRELRRNASGKVQQKQARLERLVDPAALGGVDDDIELIGGTIAETVTEVEALLGLDFNQFNKCVALPQGEFAEFLHARPADRDKILTKLLGLDGYLALGRTAGALGARQSTKAETLQAQLDRDSGACSDDTLAAARTAHDALTALSPRVDADIASLNDLDAQLNEATTKEAGLDAAIALLKAVAIPDGVTSLDADLTAARTALANAAKTAADAEQADAAARDAVRRHPPRTPLEMLAAQYAEQDQLRARAPGTAEQESVAAELRQRTRTAQETAKAVEQAAQAAETAAANAASEAASAIESAQARLALLESVRTPEDLDELLTELAQTDANVAATTAALEPARVTHTCAVSAAADLSDAVTLDRASTALSALGSAVTAAASALDAVTTTYEIARTHADAATHAQAGLLTAEAAASDVSARKAAADLRAHLTTGDSCPVCEQTVHAVPAPLDASDAAAAMAAVTAARAGAGKAGEDAARSEAQLSAAVSSFASAMRVIRSTHASAVTAVSLLQDDTQLALPDAPELTEITTVTPTSDSAEVASLASTTRAAALALADAATASASRVAVLQQQRTVADAAVTAATAALTDAEAAARRAQAAQATLTDKAQAARVALRTARDPLVALDAPALDDSDLTAAWKALTRWATGAAAAHAKVVRKAQAAATSATAAHQKTSEELAAAQQQVAAAAAAYETAIREHEHAVAAQRTLTARLDELDTALSGAAASETVTAQLTALAELEATAEQAAAAAVDARAARDDAALALKRLDDLQREARAALLAVRDPLVALGAPPLSEEGPLADAWARLTTWATATHEAKSAERDVAASTREERTLALTTAEQALRLVLTEAAVDASDDRPVRLWVAAAVAGARESAAAAVRAIEAAQARSAATQAEVRVAREQAQVANELARLLAINGFPRWLTKSALEVLVIAASSTLMELSGGQFELALADNDAASFTVIDHTDADAERPVKTLSGGETFQASLSLALALSTHLGALASNGAAQLDAIFIDEGFGTLDENTLDTVATTLETLAMNAGRMVGVVTHVPALAARVPVRFSVQRDPRGSTIQQVPA